MGVVRVEVLSAKDSVTEMPQATGNVSHRINRPSNRAEVADHMMVHPAGGGSQLRHILYFPKPRQKLMHIWQISQSRWCACGHSYLTNSKTTRIGRVPMVGSRSYGR